MDPTALRVVRVSGGTWLLTVFFPRAVLLEHLLWSADTEAQAPGDEGLGAASKAKSGRCRARIHSRVQS